MKSFKSYLVENEHTYKFRLKIAEMLDDERMDALESALEKYEVASISKPKKTKVKILLFIYFICFFLIPNQTIAIHDNIFLYII